MILSDRCKSCRWFSEVSAMDGITKILVLDITQKAEKIAKSLKKGDVELRRDGNKVKIIEVTKKTV